MQTEVKKKTTDFSPWLLFAFICIAQIAQSLWIDSELCMKCARENIFSLIILILMKYNFKFAILKHYLSIEMFDNIFVCYTYILNRVWYGIWWYNQFSYNLLDFMQTFSNDLHTDVLVLCNVIRHGCYYTSHYENEARIYDIVITFWPVKNWHQRNHTLIK